MQTSQQILRTHRLNHTLLLHRRQRTSPARSHRRHLQSTHQVYGTRKIVLYRNFRKTLNSDRRSLRSDQTSGYLPQQGTQNYSLWYRIWPGSPQFERVCGTVSRKASNWRQLSQRIHAWLVDCYRGSTSVRNIFWFTAFLQASLLAVLVPKQKLEDEVWRMPQEVSACFQVDLSSRGQAIFKTEQLVSSITPLDDFGASPWESGSGCKPACIGVAVSVY